MRVRPNCWLAHHALIEVEHARFITVLASVVFAPCDGPMTNAHLIPQRLIKRELPNAAVRSPKSLKGFLRDERIIVRACLRHHHLFDTARKLKIPRSSLPESVEEFARELNHRRIDAWLDSEYGEMSEAA